MGFAVEHHEDSDGSTLLIRSFPRKFSQEEDSPFTLTLVGELLRGLGLFAVIGLCAAWPDWRVWLALCTGLVGALVFAHYRRSARVRITRDGQFLVYESDPTRAVGRGPIANLRMDVNQSDRSMRCRWVTAEAAKSVSYGDFALVGLPSEDWLTVERFIKEHQLRGL